MLEKNMVDDKKLKAAFKFFDTDEKGFIGRDDIKLLLKTGNHATKRIMDSTATNRKRDKITFDDFKKCILPEKKEEQMEEEEPVLNGGKFSRGRQLGGPMDESSRRRPELLDESSRAQRPMDESSRRQPLSRQGRRGGGLNSRVSIIGSTNIAPDLNTLAEES